MFSLLLFSWKWLLSICKITFSNGLLVSFELRRWIGYTIGCKGSGTSFHRQQSGNTSRSMRRGWVSRRRSAVRRSSWWVDLDDDANMINCSKLSVSIICWSMIYQWLLLLYLLLLMMMLKIIWWNTKQMVSPVEAQRGSMEQTELSPSFIDTLT